MIGTTVRQKAKGSPEFEIVGFDQGAYILQSKAHGVAVRVTPEELRTDYGVPRAAAPAEGETQKGWGRLADAFYERARAARRVRGLQGPTPEESLRAQTEAAAKAAAQRIVAEGDEDKIAEFEAGLADYAPAVARELEALLSRERG